MNEPIKQWHQMTGEEVVRQQKSNASCGLSRKEARSRFRKTGGNSLFDAHRTPLWLMKKLLTDPTLLLMAAVTVFALCFSDFSSAIPTLILLAVWGIAIAGMVAQIYRQRDRLRQARIPTVSVLRDGAIRRLSARETVPGDILFFGIGDIVPADCRILNADGLRVRLLISDATARKREMKTSFKQAQTVYSYGSGLSAPDYENMLYGGSEVLAGSAKAIAVETGEHMFLRTVNASPASDPFVEDTKILSDIYPFLRLFSFAMLVWMLPFSIAALLLSPEDLASLRVFLPVCILTASASAAVPYLFFYKLLHVGKSHRAGTGNAEPIDVFPSGKATDQLPYITDLVVMGHSALSDGIFHFAGACDGRTAWISDRMPADLPQADLQPLCEAFWLLSMSQNRLPVTEFPGTDSPEQILAKELTSVSGFDTEALRVRLNRAELTDADNERIVDVYAQNGNFRLHFFKGVRGAQICDSYEPSSGVFAPILPEMQERLRNFLALSAKNGDRAMTVVKEVHARRILVGAIAIREQIPEILPNKIAQLEQMGVRIHLFLCTCGTAELCYAQRCGFTPEQILPASEETVLSNVIGTHPVYAGFPVGQIADAVYSMRKQGKKVAVVTNRASDSVVLSRATLRMACGNTPDSGCAQSVKCSADVLLPAVSGVGGGLSIVPELILSARKNLLRIKTLLRWLTSFHLFRILLLSLMILTGIGPLPAPALFYSSFIMDFAAFVFAASARIDRSHLVTPVRLGLSDLKSFFRDRKLWLIPLIPAVVMILLISLFRAFGLLQTVQCYPLLFAVMILVQIFFLIFGRGTGVFRLQFSKRLIAYFAILILPVISVLVLSALIPAVGIFTELGAWNTVSAILLIPGILSALGSVLIFSGFPE